MGTKVKFMAVFTAGIGCGVAATYIYFRDMYKKRTEEELRAMDKIMKEMREKKTTEEEKAFE